MKSKKLISLLLAGAMSLPFAFWTVSADDELTTIAGSTFNGSVDGFEARADGGWKDETRPYPVEYTNEVNHTEGDNTGALKFNLYEATWYFNYGNQRLFRVAKKLSTFENLELKKGEKYKISAYVRGTKGLADSYSNNLKFRFGIAPNNGKDGTVQTSEGAYKDVKVLEDEWTEVSFILDPTQDVNSNYYLMLQMPDGTSYPECTSYNPNTYDYAEYSKGQYRAIYLDDVKIERYAKAPFELVSVTKGGIALKNGAAVYNNEKITVEFSKYLQSDQTGAVTATAGDGTEITPSLSASLNKLYITLPDAVHDTTYTLSLGNFTALDGDTLNVGTEYSLTADNKVIFYDTFDDNLCALAQAESIRADGVTYTAGENNTDGKTAGAVRLGIYGRNIIANTQIGYYGIDRTIGGKIEAGKTYEVSAYIKGEPGRYKTPKQNEFKFALGVYPDALITSNTWYGQETNGQAQLAVSDEWQKVSFLWTPEDDGKTDYSTYRVRINPVNGQEYIQGSTESDTNYLLYYIDDITIREKPAFELIGVTPGDGAVLKAGDVGITAEFSLPVSEESVVTVKNGKGVVVNSAMTVDNRKINIAIPGRDHGETYTVIFDSIVSTAGETLTIEKTSYTYTADTTIMNQTFDENTGTFGVSDWRGCFKNCYDYSAAENRTPGKDAGSVRLSMYSTEQAWAGGKLNYSSRFGIDSDLGTGIEAGRNYVVSAYIKGEPGRYINGFKFQMGIYKLNKGSSVDDIVVNYPVDIKITDEWQKMAFVWTAPEDLSDLKLRINPVKPQTFNSGADNYDIFYIDDVSIMPVGNVPSAYLSDVAVTYTDGETTKAVATAADLNGKAVTVSATLTNLGANTQPYTLIAAVYDENGKLIDVKAAEGSMEVGSKADITVTGLDLTNVSEAAAMKIFAWDRSNNTQTPLTGVYNPF